MRAAERSATTTQVVGMADSSHCCVEITTPAEAQGSRRRLRARSPRRLPIATRQAPALQPPHERNQQYTREVEPVGRRTIRPYLHAIHVESLLESGPPRA